MHKYEVCMVSCQDPRLNQIHFELIEKWGAMGKTDTIWFGNPILDLVEPVHSLDRELVLDKIRIGVVNHEDKRVMLCNHFNCGYYRKRSILPGSISMEKERNRLIQDLVRAARIIKKGIPMADFEIFLYLLHEGKEGKWFEEDVTRVSVLRYA